MPFTLYHLGPALVIGLPLRRRIDLMTLCIASVVLDVWPALVLFGVLPGPYHWVEHTYLGGAVVAGVLTGGMVLGARQFPTKFDRWRSDEGGLTGLVIPSLVGTLLHVTLDSGTHPTMDPFTPIAGNPFGNYPPLMELIAICHILFGIGLAWLVLLYTASTRSTEERARKPSSTSPDRVFAIGPLQVISSSVKHRLLGAIIAFLGVAILLLVDATDTFIRTIASGTPGGVMLFNGLYLNGVRFR